MHDATPKPCPGPCNSAWRRAEASADETGTEHRITPTWGQPVQCYACVDRTREQLGELPTLLGDVLDEALEGTPTKLTGTIGRITVANWPGQTSRLLVDAIVGEMAELRADILVRRGIWSEDHDVRSEDKLIGEICSGLNGHWEWAMQHHPAASEPHDRGNANPGGQVTNWYRTCQRFTKQDEQRDVKRLAPCPRCHGPYLVESRELRLVDDKPYIECRDPDCRRVITQGEYDAYVKALNASIVAAA